MPCKEQINNLMSALLQETEDILKRAEQQCILNQQWQELVAIQHKRTELLKVAAFLPSLAGFEQKKAAYVQKGVVRDCMDNAMESLKKWHEEVKEMLNKEKSKHDTRLWRGLIDLDTRKRIWHQ